MAAHIIVSYDDTANDQDALALGRLFADAGATVALAYVRHTQRDERDREAREEHEAGELLERGAAAIGLPDAARHVVVNASTGEGLWKLAEREGADVIVFGSDYRTAAGTVQPGTSAQWLLNGGPTAVAIAPAGLRSRAPGSVTRVGVLAEADEASSATAQALAGALGAKVVAADEGSIDLLIVPSRPETAPGHVTLSATAQYAIDTAECPVLVVPSGTPLRFGEPALTRA